MSSTAALLMGVSVRHFHAMYAEDETSIDIRTLTVVRGALPRRALAMILEWAFLHREELLQDLDLRATKQTPRKIPMLVLLPYRGGWYECRRCPGTTCGWCSPMERAAARMSRSASSALTPVHSRHFGIAGVFAQVTVVPGAVTWPGELDLAPDAMFDALKAIESWTPE